MRKQLDTNLTFDVLGIISRVLGGMEDLRVVDLQRLRLYFHFAPAIPCAAKLSATASKRNCRKPAACKAPRQSTCSANRRHCDARPGSTWQKPGPQVSLETDRIS
jgi:hypothetical protein